MIQVSREKIFFSLPNAEVLRNDDPRRDPLTLDLVSAHVCPYCGVLAQAVYYTDQKVEDLTKDFFSVEKPMSPGKFANSTPRHESQPKFASFMLGAGGTTVEMLREYVHFSVTSTRASGCCKVSKAIYFPGEFDLIRYLFAMAKIETGEHWHPVSTDVWNRLRRCLTSPDPEWNQRNAARMYEEVKGRINIAEDVTGNGPPLWMMCKNDWGYYSINTAINNLALPPTT